MKRFLAILLAAMLVLCSALTAFAEDTDSNPNQPPQMGDGTFDGTPPEMPEGSFPGGTPPEKPEGGFPGGPGGFGGGTPPGGRTSSFEYTAATEITEAAEMTDQTYTSETVDESALIVNTAEAVSITNPTVTKTGSSDGGDNCNFYGLNAALLVMGGSTTTITGGTIDTAATAAGTALRATAPP